jgi:hypothetical protein
MSLASRTRCQWSTAMRACGSAARTPEAYGADGSITTSSIPALLAGLVWGWGVPGALLKHSVVYPSRKPGPQLVGCRLDVVDR